MRRIKEKKEEVEEDMFKQIEREKGKEKINKKEKRKRKTNFEGE